MRALVYVVASSLDGRIADGEGRADAFPTDPATLEALFERYPEMCPAHVRDAMGVTAPPRRFDTVVMGRRTLQPALDAGLTSAYPHLRQLVATHGPLPEDPSLERIEGDLVATVRALKETPGKDIWLCGGAEVAGQLLPLVDEIQIKLNPVLLGTGVPVADVAAPTAGFACVGAELLPGGVALVTFQRR